MDLELVQYYLRTKYYSSAQTSGLKAIQINLNNSVYQLYYGLSYVLQNKLSKGLTILDDLVKLTDIGLASTLVMIYAHKQFEVPDINTINMLELTVTEFSHSEAVLFHAANVMMLCNCLEKSKAYVDQLLSEYPSSVDGYLIKGWLELSENNLKSARNCFRAVQSQKNDSIEAYLGEAATLDVTEAIHILNQLIVKLPNFLPPFIEKLNLYMSIQKWSDVIETADRVLDINSDCLLAIMAKILHKIVVTGKYDEIPNQFFKTIEKSEPSPNLFIQWSSAISRTCGQHKTIINECIRAMEIAVDLEPSVNNKLELAYQIYLSGQYKKSIQLYGDLSDAEPIPKAMEGIILCHIEMNDINVQVEKQIEFLNEIRGELKSSELIFINAYCAKNNEKKSTLIKSAIEKQFDSIANLSFGPEYLIKLNPNMIMTFLKHLSDQIYKEIVLEKILNVCPGLIDCWLMLGNIQNTKKAYKSLEKVLELDPTNSEAHLMVANLLIKQGHFANASKSLDLGLSYNLSISEWPLYNLLNGLVHKHFERNNECIQALENSLNNLSNEHTLEHNNLASLFITLSECYCIGKNINKAIQTVNNAYEYLKDTNYEEEIKIAEAKISLFKNDTKNALKILNSIKSDKDIFIKAQKMKADIVMKTNQDPFEYAECFKNLVNSFPTVDNMIELSNAYLKILEPDEAIKVIKNALSLKNEPSLFIKVAQVLVAAHQYDEAIKYYSKSGNDGALEMANLLIKLNQCDMAIKVLNKLPLEVKVIPMANALEKKGKLNEALDLLKQCSYLENQELSTRLNILRHSGEIAHKLNRNDLAVSFYKQALVHVVADSDEASSLKISLAKLYMQMNDWNSCEMICSSLLKDTNNDLALLIVADLSFRRCDFVTAKKHFYKLLEKQPTNWAALARLIEVCRRTDCLEEVKTSIAFTHKNTAQAGFHFCYGLYYWYASNANEAMKHFNFAKNDAEWGQQALHNMVQICLDETTLNLNLANKLITEMKPNTPEEQKNHTLLSTYALLESKEKLSVEKAINVFNELSQESCKIAASLGLAMAFVYQKQAQRAKTILKRVALKAIWQFEEAEYLERSWLLMAELYFQSGKTNICVELVNKVLVYNKSSIKGLELLSAVAEKEQKYDDAVDYYERAWALSGYKNFKIGYKLAVNLYKLKLFSKSVEICFDLNPLSPDQVKLKKDIMDKARLSLRSR
ncbi:tetratricopeptide repeat protein 21B-like isoform X2 [Melanaphis sacchari]|nr:tetratricopeptide repeat protein 21B-like isoform X1 [Melanaphis sacchari]XP_025195910.1 tetratricopeptide repeat protein 21B-like isoform X1 [Melanaphis sacchari]XP_025195911.1 tetratricopeptide repeat protein 21B-like isoform X1 [Melanaphis sacchari]XP_025195912.1 tetratricopeptide repeat protein 21B-like isoform X1 [Melanaphis sacchari]XP_025195913.1 tetratricopeptide repeat protein 21B-like isoform X1 [Melanaphis sacchari]XP_025195914.1 tetratricopeptide repeat protein 21B-like isoform 